MQLKKSDILVLILLLASIHFFMIVVYVLPDNLVPQKIKVTAKHYQIPQFHFNYKVFAPDPNTYSERFVYRYTLKDGNKTKWIDFGNRMLIESYNNRLSAGFVKHKAYQYMGSRLFQLADYYENNPSTLHLGKEEIKNIVEEKVIDHELYNKAVSYGIKNSNHKKDSIAAIEFGYVRIAVSDKFKDENLVKIFPKYYIE